ncbi:serine hydrolase domain-containing protein [Limosilactobacillus pontis]|uniref:serine hydrolase domain-containing protein n=1 Tax=Limosilactobacillus pontis TaxID=35787 RepID=UPI002420082D|nr:serine hydrolase domain-containing protein [Limosilactobacillus pontis]
MERYQKTIKQLNAMVDDGVVPGMTYLIFDGKREWRASRGWAQLKPTREKLRPKMVYDLASLTKVVGTVPVVAMLIQEGRLGLDDPVQQYLPEFGDPRPTIRNLLTHTSGIRGYIPHRNVLPADRLITAFLTSQTVDSTLNRQIRYADVNYLYLGWIVERLCGRPVQEVIAQRVLTPLGMKTATFQPGITSSVPTEIQDGRGLIRGQVHDPKGYILGTRCGCAGLFAGLSDLVIFSRQLIENQLGGLLDAKIVDAMFIDQTRIPGPHSRSLGWKLLHDQEDDHLLISHTGFTGTWLILDRQTDQGFIFLSNRVHPTAANQEYLNRRDQIYATYLREKAK